MENNRRWRTFSRDEIALPVDIRTANTLWERISRPLKEGSVPRAASGQTENISPSGLCLRVGEKEPFKVGQEVSLRFGPGIGGQALRLQGLVVWTSQNHPNQPRMQMGLQITRFPHNRDQEGWFGILLSGGPPPSV